jgi:phosphate transport system substrate-binding protein
MTFCALSPTSATNADRAPQGPRHLQCWWAVLGLFVMVLVGCEGAPAAPRVSRGVTRITIAGSTAMLPLVAEAANAFMRRHPGVAIDVAAGGSALGLRDVASGRLDIGMSDVPPDPAQYPGIVDHRVAVTVFAAVTHRGLYNREISSLSLEQLRAVFTGQATNWRDLGGEDHPIVVINRRRGSGTRMTFGQVVLGGDHFLPGVEEDSSQMVRSLVSQTPGSISYLAVSYLNETVCGLAVEDVEPTDENVVAGRYPLWSWAHLLTRGPATDISAKFLDYMLSQEVQQVMAKNNGFLTRTALTQDRGR